jgi:tetratricopeptide (TPR) repeat protein
MRKILLAAALSAGIMSSAASAGVVVVGTSPARGCYESARAENGSQVALEGCNAAFDSGMLSFYEQVATHVNRGIVRLFGDDTLGAIVDFDRAIALDPAQAESYLNKGAAYLKLERNAEARALFDEALQRRTKRPELAYFGRAIANETTGNIRAAYQDYQRAQAAAPKWADPARELTRFQIRPAGGSL